MPLFVRPIRRVSFYHSPVLGTDATGHISSRARRPEQLEALLLQRVDDLENTFSVYRPKSEFNRWWRNEITTDALSVELRTVLQQAKHWQTVSGGAFNPSVGIASELWTRAADRQALPSQAALEQAAQQIAAPSTKPRNLNAIAKGFIVDQAADRVHQQAYVDSIVLNLGGDLVHRGNGFATVSIQNPLRAYENEPPLFRLNITNAAVATSGSAARGWSINGAWFSHVLDPRTAQPVSHIASATAVARSATEADALATILSVCTDDERTSFAATLDPTIAFCVVRSDGSAHTNQMWDALCT
jgi:FAD:protein FMN transferase